MADNTTRHNYPGTLISIEGIDGAGKDTVIASDQFQNAFSDAIYASEPNDDTVHGQYVRAVIADETAPPLTVFFAFLADHAANIENTIRPALIEGETIVCNRGIDSRYAYQKSELDGVVDDPLTFIRSIQEEGWSIFPDVTVLIDISAETAMERIGVRKKNTERFEKLDSLQEKRDIYLTLAEEFNERYVVVDGSKSEDEVARDVVDKITEKLTSIKNPSTA